MLLYVAMIVFFAFFYTAIVFNPTETADNLKKHGGFLPGIRPGERTAQYIDQVLTRITVIGAAYLLGASEIARFRARTRSLAAAIAAVPQPLPALSDWLFRVHPALRAAVRLRIEGERVALPGLVLTPYLLGLLVMLGMLGTFLVTMTGLPALAAPAGFSPGGLPAGIQIIGRRGADRRLRLLSPSCRR
jgi:hypothetical protein